jgi:hypothetical protein
LIVHADLSEFYRVWLGFVDYATALRTGTITIEGTPALVRDFPEWLMWSPMARHVRDVQKHPPRAAGTGPRPRRMSAGRKALPI